MGNIGGGGGGGAGGGGAPGGGGFGIMLPLLAILVIFYFLLIRPQQRSEKKRKEMLAQIKKGDRVITAGGIRGTVAKVYDKEKIVLVTIAPNVDVEIALAKIEAAAPPGEKLPAEGEAAKESKEAAQDKSKGGKGPRRPRGK